MSDDIPAPPSDDNIPDPPEPDDEKEKDEEKPLDEAIEGGKCPWDDCLDDEWFEDVEHDPFFIGPPF